MNTKSSLSTPPQWGIITTLWLVLYDFTGQLLSRQLAIIFVKLFLDKSSCSCRQRCAASSCIIRFFIEEFFFLNKCHQFSARPLYQLAVPSVPNSLLLACFVSIFPISLLYFWLCICLEKVFFNIYFNQLHLARRSGSSAQEEKSFDHTVLVYCARSC